MPVASLAHVKNWQESRQVFEWLSTLRAEQRRAALATVVSVRGSAYRREGAKMAVAEDGAAVGNVSGGCLEMDVREVARAVIDSGIPQLRSYCSGDEVRAWDLGTGCEGQVRIFIEPAYACGIEQTLLDATISFAVCTIIGAARSGLPRHRLIITSGQRASVDLPAEFRPIVEDARIMLAAGASSAVREIGGMTVFADIYRPPPQLVIVGAGNDARPLAKFAVEAGFRTVVVDRRPALLAPDRFPEATRLVASPAAELTSSVDCDADTCAVVMTHHFADDTRYLRALLTTPARYIGVLGPRQRAERLRQQVAFDARGGVDRIRGPIGLDLGGEGAEQVALAIVAELLAVRSGRTATPLRDRETPIHQRADAWRPAPRS